MKLLNVKPLYNLRLALVFWLGFMFFNACSWVALISNNGDDGEVHCKTAFTGGTNLRFRKPLEIAVRIRTLK